MRASARTIILSVAVLLVVLLLPGVALATDFNAPPLTPPVDTYVPLPPPSTLTCAGITDPLMIQPRTVYDFSTDALYSIPTTFPDGTFSGNTVGVRAIGSGWGTWNPQVDGKHVLFVYDHTIRFTSLQQAVGVVAESNSFGMHDITIEAFDSSGKLIGRFTRTIDGYGGAAFLGLSSSLKNIASVKLTADPGASGFAYSDLTFGTSLVTFLAPLRPQDPKVFSNSWRWATNLPVRLTMSNVAGLKQGGLVQGMPAPTLDLLDPLGHTCLQATLAWKVPQFYFETIIPRTVLCSWADGHYTLVVHAGGFTYEIPIQVGVLTPSGTL